MQQRAVMLSRPTHGSESGTRPHTGAEVTLLYRTIVPTDGFVGVRAHVDDFVRLIAVRESAAVINWPRAGALDPGTRSCIAGLHLTSARLQYQNLWIRG